MAYSRPEGPDPTVEYRRRLAMQVGDMEMERVRMAAELQRELERARESQYLLAGDPVHLWSEAKASLKLKPKKDNEMTAAFNLDLDNNKLTFGTVANGQIVNLNGDFKVNSQLGGGLGGSITGDFIGDIKGNNTIPITIPHVASRKTNYNIMVVGTGGTGGYLIRDLGRFFYALREKGDTRNFNITLIDADTVEEKNVLRQNFTKRDIGKSKAETMAKRYSNAFGLEIQAIKKMADVTLINKMIQEANNSGDYYDTTHILIGCVDNNEARRSFQQVVDRTENTYWIDSGNEQKSGQVVLGYGRRPRGYGGYQTPPRETDFWMPNVTDLYPEILDANEDPKDSGVQSCAERSLVDTQNIFVNMTAAGHTLGYLRQIIMEEKITINKIEFNIKGLTSVDHITDGYLKGIYEGVA